MTVDTKSSEVKIEKIKAIRPQIIVTGTVDKPYYEILYYDTSDNVWRIGYSSYILANVIKWKEECFEVVGELEDMEEVKHGEWLYLESSDEDYSYFWKCSLCGYYGWHKGKYCPHCGAKMDGGNAE